MAGFPYLVTRLSVLHLRPDTTADIRAVALGSALLSVRGKVLEHGMPRFFRRLTEGVFDEEDLRRRADELADFVVDARNRYGLAAPIALGYSNGANIAAAILLLRPDVFAGAMLLRAMVPLRQAPKADLAGKPVLIVSGKSDPIIPPDNSARLATMLQQTGADVQHRTLPVGHQLSQADLTLSKAWLRARKSSARDGSERTRSAVRVIEYSNGR